MQEKIYIPEHIRIVCVMCKKAFTPGDYHPYVLRAVTTNGELLVVTEGEAINNEN